MPNWGGLLDLHLYLFQLPDSISGLPCSKYLKETHLSKIQGRNGEEVTSCVVNPTHARDVVCGVNISNFLRENPQFAYMQIIVKISDTIQTDFVVTVDEIQDGQTEIFTEPFNLTTAVKDPVEIDLKMTGRFLACSPQRIPFMFNMDNNVNINVNDHIIDRNQRHDPERFEIPVRRLEPIHNCRFEWQRVDRHRNPQNGHKPVRYDPQAAKVITNGKVRKPSRYFEDNINKRRRLEGNDVEVGKERAFQNESYNNQNASSSRITLNLPPALNELSFSSDHLEDVKPFSGQDIKFILSEEKKFKVKKEDDHDMNGIHSPWYSPASSPKPEDFKTDILYQRIKEEMNKENSWNVEGGREKIRQESSARPPLENAAISNQFVACKPAPEDLQSTLESDSLVEEAIKNLTQIDPKSKDGPEYELSTIDVKQETNVETFDKLIEFFQKKVVRNERSEEPSMEAYGQMNDKGTAISNNDQISQDKVTTNLLPVVAAAATKIPFPSTVPQTQGPQIPSTKVASTSTIQLSRPVEHRVGESSTGKPLMAAVHSSIAQARKSPIMPRSCLKKDVPEGSRKRKRKVTFDPAQVKCDTD